MRNFCLFFFIVLISGCLGIPDNITPVANFDLNKYLGKWYEIARLDHSFERGLQQVSAEYTVREDGGVKVINRGYSTEDEEWQEAEGKAFFVEGPNTGYLKVSFFGPFYGAYVVFDLDSVEYQYSYVTSSNKSYLWFLSRSPAVNEKQKEHFLKKIRELGFDENQLIFVKQD